MTETEPEFDVNERDDWYSLREWEEAVCPKCGNLRAVCSDPEQVWYPQRNICWASADLEVHNRNWEKKHKDAHPDPQGRLPTDGTTLWVSPEDLTPDDDFL